jgi:integrase
MKIALLHNAQIGALTLPEGAAETTFWDHGHADAVTGFGLRMRAAGGRVWVFQYKLGARHHRIKIGTAPLTTLERARSQAREIRRKLEAGANPALDRTEVRKQAAQTFGVFTDKYLAWRQRQPRPLKARSFEEASRHLKVSAKPLHSRLLTSIGRSDVASLLAEIEERSGPTARNRTRADLSSFFSWALREGFLGETGSNPAAWTGRATEIARDRVLTASELCEVWAALPALGDTYGDIMRLLLLTGQRRDEIGGLRWEEVDFDASLISLPPERVKNSREHLIPMSPPVIEILRARPRVFGRHTVFGVGASGRGFQGWHLGKAALDARIEANRLAVYGGKAKPMPPWRQHDLRRTFDTMLNDLGVAPHVVEALLNHVSSTKSGKSGVAGIYNRAGYFRERTAALNMWADHLAALVGARL